MTRMWCIGPRLLCRQHLLGEHAEIHQEVGQIAAGNVASVRGHAESGQVDTSRLQSRHDTLASELRRRGYSHNSPLDYDDSLNAGSVSSERARRELARRCPACAHRIARHSNTAASAGGDRQ